MIKYFMILFDYDCYRHDKVFYDIITGHIQNRTFAFSITFYKFKKVYMQKKLYSKSIHGYK